MTMVVMILLGSFSLVGIEVGRNKIARCKAVS